MNRTVTFLILICLTVSCNNSNSKKIPLAKAGNSILYLDQLKGVITSGTSPADSTLIVKNYINKWAKRELMFQKAEENLTPELMKEIDSQVNEARMNLVIYQYQRQMMLTKMDTTINDTELETYYFSNRDNFKLNSNIVKALFIKLPAETPGLSRIKSLARTNNQASLPQLESLCYQFAEKFDDFNEKWVDMDQLSLELPAEIQDQENFLRRTTFYETTNADSTFIYLLTIRDYKLRSSAAPFEYVKDDIKRIIWNNRRIEFIQSLENGIYNDALKENIFTLLNK